MKKQKSSEIDFPTTEEYTAQDIKRVQGRLLEMAIWVRDILDRNEIPYFLAFGTLLGAVRHEGFVPWDDDFDLFLFDESYDRAMEVLECELPEELVVHSRRNDPLYFKAWCSIRDTKTEVVDAGLYHPDNSRLGYPCLGLDLYRMKKMPRNFVPIYKIEEAIEFFKRKLESGLIDQPTHDKEVKSLEGDRAQLLESRSEDDDTTNVFAFMVTLRRPFLVDEILPLKNFMFEGVHFKGPACSEAVLTSSYGDYQSLPEYSDRKPHFKKAIFR
ncbi:MAG: LicD family protein [Opitutaceae bacterium]